MTIIIAILSTVAFVLFNIYDKCENEALRRRLEEYGPGEVIG